MSWHASFVNDYQQFQPMSPYFNSHEYDMYGNTTVTHGLLTPSSFAMMDESYMDCPNVPLDHMNNQDINVLQNSFQFGNMYANVHEGNPYYHAATTTGVDASGSIGHTMMAWPYNSTDFGQDIHTAPVTPDFLPLPDFGNPFDGTYVEEAADKDELVGMGLYDSPAEVQSASLLFGGSLLVRRKSLKLEESFEPDPLSDDEAGSDMTQQDHTSVASAESQAETIMTIPPADMPTHLQSTDYTMGLGSYQALMMPVTSLAGMGMSAGQHTSGYF
jgi:hypothetical protein